MNELKIFENPDFGEIRIVERDGEPWFVGKDVALALGYTDTAQAIRKHVDDEDKGVVDSTTPGGIQKLTIINESGVYSLIFSSKLEKAQQFKRWVTAEVLPAIRRTGGYLTPAAEARLEQLLDARLKGLQDLADRVTALENAWTAPFGSIPTLPVPELQAHCLGTMSRTASPPGRDYMKRWMRTASEKLGLMGSRFNMSNNAILHHLYSFLEEEFDVVLADERIRIMEEYGLDDCSTLKAIFYEEDFRDYLEVLIDHNLAPENRGW